MTLEQHGVDAWGITDGYFDIEGTWHETIDAVRNAIRSAMGDPAQLMPADAQNLWFVTAGDVHQLWNFCRIVLEDGTDWGNHDHLPANLPIGYHSLEPLDASTPTKLFVRPPQMPRPPAKAWGVAAQFYALMSEHSQGVGDLADLADFAVTLQQHGGSILVVNPLHAPSPESPQQNSPYYASSRLWRNPLFLRVDGLEPSRPALIDRDAVWAAKRAALWREFSGDAYDVEKFELWRANEGADLQRYASWVAAKDDPSIAENPEFQAWLQWKVLAQLAMVSTSAPAVRLVGDLAIGFDPSGADAHEFAELLATGCRIGSPPDAFNAFGQDWGLPPFIPWRLRAAGYEPLIRTFRAAFSGFHGLRIDHVMGLFRQFWLTPIESGVLGGAYVRFPHDEMLAVLAIEASRANAFVIGEDLGTVQPVVWEAMNRDGLLGTTVTWFSPEQPIEYRPSSLAAISTHDLPTIAGVWSGVDGDDSMRERITQLTGLEPGAPIEDVVVAMHTALAIAPSQLIVATTDDLCLATERPNVPGTIDAERANWRIPLPKTLEQLASSELFTRVAGILNEATGSHIPCE